MSDEQRDEDQGGEDHGQVLELRHGFHDHEGRDEQVQKWLSDAQDEGLVSLDDELGDVGLQVIHQIQNDEVEDDGDHGGDQHDGDQRGGDRDGVPQVQVLHSQIQDDGLELQELHNADLDDDEQVLVLHNEDLDGEEQALVLHNGLLDDGEQVLVLHNGVQGHHSLDLDVLVLELHKLDLDVEEELHMQVLDEVVELHKLDLDELVQELHILDQVLHKVDQDGGRAQEPHTMDLIGVHAEVVHK